MGLVESQDQKHSLRDKGDLGLFMGLRNMRIHSIMYRDACSLSSLKNRGIFDISRARVLLYKEVYGETLTLSQFSPHF